MASWIAGPNPISPAIPLHPYHLAPASNLRPTPYIQPPTANSTEDAKPGIAWPTAKE
ncbi:MAG: hypothetical protein NTV68_00375 [Methanomicrobiales archaeon]|nr:hypothetical protein [Methanomicrobiales archaeon]